MSEPLFRPKGVVTLLFTDVEGSTRSWELETDLMRSAIELHDNLAAKAFTSHHGVLVKERGEGDSLFAYFQSPLHAVQAAVTFQRLLSVAAWPTEKPIRVRIGIHTGDVTVRDHDLYGPTVNRCARIRSCAHGGQIVVSASVQRLIAGLCPSEIELHPLGRVRLRDLREPEALYQVTAEGLDEEFPSLKTIDLSPNNLPIQLQSYVGREADIGRLSVILKEKRLVTLIGTGGCGKTRLALQVAAESMELGKDGVAFVDLSSITRGQVAQAVESAINEFSPDRSAAPLLKRVGHREIVLLLDNCEHVVDEAATWTQEVLTSCRGVRILATSREPLNVPGEQCFRVESLTIPEPGSTLEVVLEAEAVQLFVERARERWPQFELVEGNAEEVATICRELDGMPLAIEHAAAQISSMSPREMRDRLQDKFRFLKSRHRGPFTRHATMQSTIDWSYDLLLDDEKKLLPLLSIFRGSWDLSLCREIAGAIGFTKWQTEDSLDGLVSKSLVSLDSVQEDARLFRLLEMIKAYAAERLGPEIETKCLARLCGYYYAFAATQNEATLNRWVGQDLPNIGRVVEWAVAAKDARCLELIHSIRNILRRGGHAKRGGEMLSILLRGEVTTDPALLARGWNALGMMLWNQDLFHESMEAFERSRSYYLNLFDEESIIGVENNLAIINAELGRSEEAIELFEKVLTGYRRLNNVALIAQVNGNLASLKYNMGDAPGAVSHFEEVGGAGMEDPSVRANFLKNYALALVEAGRPGEAEVQLSRAFAIWQDVPDLLALSGALIGIAHLRMNCSEDSKVARLIGASHMVEQRTGSQRSAGERRLLISVESYLRSHMEPAAMTRATKLGQAFTVQNALNLAKDLLPASKAGLLA